MCHTNFLEKIIQGREASALLEGHAENERPMENHLVKGGLQRVREVLFHWKIRWRKRCTSRNEKMGSEHCYRSSGVKDCDLGREGDQPGYVAFRGVPLLRTGEGGILPLISLQWVMEKRSLVLSS